MDRIETPPDVVIRRLPLYARSLRYLLQEDVRSVSSQELGERINVTAAQIRKDLHLGQTVRFMDWRDGQMRVGTVVAMKDTQLTIQEQATRSAWTVPYTAVEPPTPGAANAAQTMSTSAPHRRASNDRTILPSKQDR